MTTNEPLGQYCPEEDMTDEDQAFLRAVRKREAKWAKYQEKLEFAQRVSLPYRQANRQPESVPGQLLLPLRAE